MCIIVVKPKEKDIQDKKVLERCFTSNKDGAGYMFVNKQTDTVEIKKGFMKFEDFYKSVMDDYKKYNLKDQNLIMHFRIGTSGKSATGCTHPFPISSSYDSMEHLRESTNIGVCHNGVVSMFNSYMNEHSDTQIYIKNVLAPIIKLNINAYKFKDIQTLISKTTNSKWAFLDKFDEFYLVGDFVTDKGYYYSNTSYKEPKYVYVPKYDYDDYYYNNWWNKKSNQKTTPTSSNLLLQSKPSNEPKEVIYKALTKGMVFIGGTTYIEIEVDGEYYIDKSYNVYTYNDTTKQFDKKYSNALVYSNDNFTQRIDYSTLGVN